MEYDAAQVKRMLASQRLIAAALQRGALNPRSALTWAARGGRGEDISIVGALTGSEHTAAANRRVQAHSNTQLAQQILDLLGQAVDGAPEPDDEYAGIFPPNDMPRRTLVYDQNDDGSRPAPRTVPDATVPPGYQYGMTSNVHTPYASAARGRYDDADRIADQQADLLFPAGRTAAESAQASAIARQEERERAAGIRSGALDPYSDEDLLGLLFGDAT